jgi:hypothetical protein
VHQQAGNFGFNKYGNQYCFHIKDILYWNVLEAVNAPLRFKSFEITGKK